MPEFEFEITLAAKVRVPAGTAAEAEAAVRRAFQQADCNGGAWADGSPVLFDASIEGKPVHRTDE